MDLRIKTHAETTEILDQKFKSGKPFMYTRFGDADVFFMYSDFKKNRRHTASPRFREELREAWEIDDKNYLIGCAVHGGTLSLGKLRNLIKDHVRERPYETATAILELYRNSPELFIKFCKENLHGKKVNLIGGPAVCNNKLVRKALNISNVIAVTDTEAYYSLDKKMGEINRTVQNYDINIVALGQAGRILAKRLYVAGINSTVFDIGSPIDALAELRSRSWIRRLPAGFINQFKTEFL